MAAAQQPSVVVHGDDITIRGCVGPAATGNVGAPQAMVWTRSDIMLSNAMAIQAGQASPLTSRVFYWLDDDKDLAKHVGQMIEVKGDLGDFKKGEIEVHRDGDVAKIELKLGGKTEKAKVPTAWLGPTAGEGEAEFLARKVHVDKVNVLGACTTSITR